MNMNDRDTACHIFYISWFLHINQYSKKPRYRGHLKYDLLNGHVLTYVSIPSTSLKLKSSETVQIKTQSTLVKSCARQPPWMLCVAYTSKNITLITNNITRINMSNQYRHILFCCLIFPLQLAVSRNPDLPITRGESPKRLLVWHREGAVSATFSYWAGVISQSETIYTSSQSNSA